MAEKNLARSHDKSQPSLVPHLAQRTTAYDLLTMVAELIHEEPRRYDQERWISVLSVESVPDELREQVPACGTICCVAGWINTLRSSPTIAQQWYFEGRSSQQWGTTLAGKAARTLGISRKQSGRLFDGMAISKLARRRRIETPERGSADYAALGIAHIRAFQKRHAAQLRAKVVLPYRARTPEAEAHDV